MIFNEEREDCCSLKDEDKDNCSLSKEDLEHLDLCIENNLEKEKESCEGCEN